MRILGFMGMLENALRSIGDARKDHILAIHTVRRQGPLCRSWIPSLRVLMVFEILRWAKAKEEGEGEVEGEEEGQERKTGKVREGRQPSHKES